jgi:hypothetical protein
LRISLALALVLVLAVPGAGAQDVVEALRYDEAGLTVALPAGFAARSAGPLHPPGVGVYTFEDAADTRVLFIELHTYLAAAERDEWAAGAFADRAYQHMDRVEAVDPAGLGAPGSAAFEVEGTAGQRLRGYVSYGCAGARCYKVEVLGRAESFAANLGAFRAALSGVQFDD